MQAPAVVPVQLRSAALLQELVCGMLAIDWWSLAQAKPRPTNQTSRVGAMTVVSPGVESQTQGRDRGAVSPPRSGSRRPKRAEPRLLSALRVGPFRDWTTLFCRAGPRLRLGSSIPLGGASVAFGQLPLGGASVAIGQSPTGRGCLVSMAPLGCPDFPAL